MEEIQGLYAWGPNQDVGIISKFFSQPMNEGPHFCSSTSIYRLIHHLLYLVPAPHSLSPSPNLDYQFSHIRTHINSCISLDVFHIGLGKAEVSGWPLSRADDARCDRVLQCKRTSHGNNKLPLPDIS